MHIALSLQRPLATAGLRPTRPAGLLRALPALHRRRRRPTIAASAALSPALPVTLTAATAVVTRLAASAARAVVMVAAAGAAATVAALVATGAWASTTASHPAVWALLASFLGSRLAARATRVDARRLRTALADHSETLAGIERGVAILYGSLDNLSHLHLETARRTASLASELDVALAVLLEDRYEAFRAAVAEHERAQRAAAAQRLWGSDAPDAHGAAALAGRPPAREQQYPSPLAGLTPEARAAVVADRLATLGSAIGALVVSSWVVGSGAAAPCVPAAAQPRQVLALPLPEGAVCVSLGVVDGGDAEQPVAGPLWRRLAWAAGALRGKM